MNTVKLGFICLLSMASFLSYAQDIDDDGNVQINPIIVVEPDPELREVYEAQIDSEFFEVGFFAGIISMEDFGTDVVTGFKASFHATEDFFLQGNYGNAEAGLSSQEVSTDSRLFIDREYEYYNLLIGYNLFPGESFITQNLTLNSTFYVVAGAGNTKLNKDDHFTTTIGSGYRIILKDWLTFNLDMRDMSFKSQVLGPSKRTHNLEFTAGLTAFF